MLKKLVGLIFLTSGFMLWSMEGQDDQAQALQKLRDQKLFDAIEKEDEKSVVEAIDAGGNVNAQMENGGTPLMVASTHGLLALRQGRKQIIEILLERGAKVDALDTGGWTALIYALFFGHFGVADFLIKRGARSTGFMFKESDKVFRALQTKFNFYLHRSVVGRRLDGAQAALNLGADINGWTIGDERRMDAPIVTAAQYRYMPMVELLVERGANVNSQNQLEQSALSWAKYHGDVQLVMYLVEHGAQVEGFSFSFIITKPLLTEILNKNVDEVKSILANRYYGNIELNEEEIGEALPLAVALNEQGIVDTLLAHFGTYITNESIERSLISAISAKNLESFKRFYLLARKKLSYGEFKRAVDAALLWAVTSRDGPVVGFILERAFAYNEIVDLNVAEAGRRLAELLRTPLTQEEREALQSIGKSLVAAPRLREIARATSQGTPLERLLGLIPQLPPELIALILGITVQPNLPK